HADPITEQKQDQVFYLPGQNFNVDFAQYAGYVTVNEENGRALFYWLTEATQDPASKPLVLWLNGGPGCSSIAYGMSEEVGPFHVDKDGKSVYLNPYSWNTVANLLFIDSPVGVGYSYSNTSSDIESNGDKRTAEDLLQFVLNWLERFPQYKGRDFYMTGESYAGHYVPQLSQVIVRYNKENTGSPINLKGYLVGNALTDEYHDHLGLYQFWWTVGLISDQTYKKLNDVCDNAFYMHPSQECVQIRENLLQEVGNIDPYSIFTPSCTANDVNNKLLRNWHVGNALTDEYHDHLGLYQFWWTVGLISDQTYKKLNDVCDKAFYMHPSQECVQIRENLLQEVELVFGKVVYGVVAFLENERQLSSESNWKDKDKFKVLTALSRSQSMKKLVLLVGSLVIVIMNNEGASDSIEMSWQDSPLSMLDVYHELISAGLRIWMFSGDTDGVIPVTSTRNTINALNLTTISPWRAWYEDGQVGGWTQKYDGLTFVAVRGAGHKVPLHKPKLALTLLKSFIAGTPMPSFEPVIESKISSQVTGL
nr:serine carboxypeptidase II-2 [Tanacetum cinerariifolium]